MTKDQIKELNRQRSHEANRALVNFGEGKEDCVTNLVDLLANSMHLLGTDAVRSAVRVAETHYNAEQYEA